MVVHLAAQAPNIWKLCMPVRRFGRSQPQNTNLYSASGILEVSRDEVCYSSALGYTEGQSRRNDGVRNALGSQAFHESPHHLAVPPEAQTALFCWYCKGKNNWLQF